MTMRWRTCARQGMAVFVALAAARVHAADVDAARLFVARCGSCHSFGKGDRVGPDLKGVTERRTREWLLGWIRSSEKVIRAGDPTALALFAKYRKQRMPDQDLSQAQIGGLVDYFAAGAPEARRELPVTAATAADTRRGEALFYGRLHLASGGIACAACHSVSQRRMLGGTLAPDLGALYARYQDREFSRVLGAPCFPRTPSLGGVRVVTDDESLALRAFLDSSRPSVPAPHAP